MADTAPGSPANPPTRLLHVHPDLGNSTSLFESLVTGLAEKNFDQTVIYLAGTPDQPNRLEAAGIDVVRMNKTASQLRGIRWSTVRQLAGILRDRQPDAILCQRHKPTTLTALAAWRSGSKAKICSHVHGRNRTRNWRRRLMNRWVFKRLYKIVAVSEAVRQSPPRPRQSYHHCQRH